MDGSELAELIDQRLALLTQLLQLSERQMDAIKGSRMTELMGVLWEKQVPLNQLAELAKRLRPAVQSDPEARVWGTPEQRVQCRERQGECERMHLELLAIEAQCETLLTQGKVQLQAEMQRVDSARKAISGYGAEQMAVESGGHLDLTNHG